jgi:hypothetical protein
MPSQAIRPLLWLVLVMFVACVVSRDHAALPAYPEGSTGLRAMFVDVLEAAKRDDRERVHDLFAAALMTDAELRQLFGARAEALLPRYHQLMGTLINRGAVELVAQIYDRRYDTVDVEPDEHDGNVRALLTMPLTLYSVRLRKATDTRGLRYDFFFYLNGHWRTGNQIAKFIDAGVDGGH